MTEKEAIDVAKVMQAVGGAARPAAQYVAGIPGRVAGIPGAVGGFALNTARRAGNVLGSGVAQLVRPGIHPMNAPGVNRALFNVMTGAENLGNKTVGKLRKSVGRAFGVAPASNFNPLNMATGAGILGGGYALRGKAPSAAPPAAPAAPAAGGGFGGLSQRGMAMWNSLPIEARYAIGAGVPLALLGGYMGRKGGLGGLGLGALGLGAAALGGASGGMFGDNARRFSGKLLYNVGSFFGGGGNDPGSQLGLLSKLSPELGTTALMGRDPNLSAQDARQQYDFLTQNRDMINKLLPSLAGKSASALVKGARCWKGYEPVPGKAPYSEDSCRPVGSKKKKKKEEKKASFPFSGEGMGLTQMRGLTFDPNNANVQTMQAQFPNNWHATMAQPQGLFGTAFNGPPIQSMPPGFLGKFAASVAFKLTEKKHDEVISGGKPSTEGVSHHKVTPRDPSEGENLRPHGALVAPDSKPESD